MKENELKVDSSYTKEESKKSSKARIMTQEDFERFKKEIDIRMRKVWQDEKWKAAESEREAAKTILNI